MKRNDPERHYHNTTDALAEHIAAVGDECHRAVKILSSRTRLTDATLAECARLGDSLESTHRFLRFAVAQIAIARRKRGRTGRVG
jgi:hypothetical protein